MDHRHLAAFVEKTRAQQASGCGAEDRLAAEYSAIRTETVAMKLSLGLTTDMGALKGNLKKNRYKDILPYDQSLVPLTLLADQGAPDYINASFIQGAAEHRSYIATQGPLLNTLGDFWRMIWQYRVKVIVMACREFEMGKKKCERYWPELNETSTFDPFLVSCLEESSPNKEVIVRTLNVQFQGDTHSVSQFQYTAWPDHGIPNSADSILGMMKMAHSKQGNDTAPILVHCSAGCGRTGVICTIDYIHDLLQTRRITADFSIKDIVLDMRRQRPAAVQTKEQYEFLHSTVAQMFEKTLESNSCNYKSQTEDRAPLYDNVDPVTKVQKGSSPIRNNGLQTPRKAPVKPQTSAPPKGQNMNDTYAVVNKRKPLQPRDPAAQPPSPSDGLPMVHHYDNEPLVSLRPKSAPANVLYSTVKPKPKARFVGSPTTLPTPLYDTAAPSSQRQAGGAFLLASPVSDPGSYDFPGGVSESLRRDQKALSSYTAKKNLESPASTDDDYEYVSSTRKEDTDYCTANGLGFNCRIKKPKGPRDPPAEWGRAER
ncbi:tyrosine-protein phosphatase non-receptor type 18 [Lepisosteus oculatus]|uniref:tyrosine-protein phosphatase non-receptor type 18 n=1 Tax=Lepisosteus oculatus TaxID=7918 RepID=UPI0035F51841